MIPLDFISNVTYRSALEQTFTELEHAIQTSAWRSAMLLAGGIFESLATLYLNSNGFQKKYNIDPLQLPIDKAMAACVKESIKIAGSPEAKKLVILYRKLIHPNTEIRLTQNIEEKQVMEAMDVLRKMVQSIASHNTSTTENSEPQEVNIRSVKPVAAQPEAEKSPKGVSPKDFVAQITSGSASRSEIERTIADMDEAQLKELATTEIFLATIAQHKSSQTGNIADITHVLIGLRSAFRKALNSMNDAAKTEVLNEHASLLHGEKRPDGILFIDYLFSSEDISVLIPTNASLVKKHIFQRMEKSQNQFFLDSIQNIWFYLTKDEIDEFTNICLSCAIYGSTQDVKLETKGWMNRNKWEEMNDELRSNVLTPLQRWIENYEFFNDESHADIVRELKGIVERK